MNSFICQEFSTVLGLGAVEPRLLYQPAVFGTLSANSCKDRKGTRQISAGDWPLPPTPQGHLQTAEIPLNTAWSPETRSVQRLLSSSRFLPASLRYLQARNEQLQHRASHQRGREAFIPLAWIKLNINVPEAFLGGARAPPPNAPGGFWAGCATRAGARPRICGSRGARSRPSRSRDALRPGRGDKCFALPATIPRRLACQHSPPASPDSGSIARQFDTAHLDALG